MNGNEFLKMIKRHARDCGLDCHLDEGHGKGSHGRLYLGSRFTTLKDRKKEIGPGLLKAMLEQLGLSKKDLGL